MKVIYLVTFVQDQPQTLRVAEYFMCSLSFVT